VHPWPDAGFAPGGATFRGLREHASDELALMPAAHGRL